LKGGGRGLSEHYIPELSHGGCEEVGRTWKDSLIEIRNREPPEYKFKFYRYVNLLRSTVDK
jgi:hypothetical protein